MPPVCPNDERNLTLSQHVFKFCFLSPGLGKLEKLRNPWIFISNCVSGLYKSIIVCFILSGNVLKFPQNESRSNLNLTFHASEVSQQRAIVIDLGLWSLTFRRPICREWQLGMFSGSQGRVSDFIPKWWRNTPWKFDFR